MKNKNLVITERQADIIIDCIDAVSKKIYESDGNSPYLKELKDLSLEVEKLVSQKTFRVPFWGLPNK